MAGLAAQSENPCNLESCHESERDLHKVHNTLTAIKPFPINDIPNEQLLRNLLPIYSTQNIAITPMVVANPPHIFFRLRGKRLPPVL